MYRGPIRVLLVEVIEFHYSFSHHHLKIFYSHPLNFPSKPSQCILREIRLFCNQTFKLEMDRCKIAFHFHPVQSNSEFRSVLIGTYYVELEGLHLNFSACNALHSISVIIET